MLRRHGVMLEAARGPVPNLVDAIVGGRRRGSWWSHPRGREIFAVTRALRDSPQVLVTRLVNGRITYVHRRLWPALARLALRLPHEATARLREVHTRTGAHRIETVAFPRWTSAAVRRRAATLSEEAAIQLLGDGVSPQLRRHISRRSSS